MGSINETFKTFNATARTLIAAVVVAGAGYAGYTAYSVYNQPQKQLADKQAELDGALADLETARGALEQSQQQVERLETSLNLLKIDQRVAELAIVDRRPGEGPDDPPITTVEFVETDPEGKPIGEPRRFDVPGEQIYLEYLVVKFDDAYVEQADLERGTAICLFQRLFGNAQTPDQGFRIDSPGTRPTAYARGGRMSEFEQRIWADFWDIAHDEQRQAAMGIRAAHADAPSVKSRPGARYRLEIRTTGDFKLETVAE